jgi:hypothetical protein
VGPFQTETPPRCALPETGLSRKCARSRALGAAVAICGDWVGKPLQVSLLGLEIGVPVHDLTVGRLVHHDFATMSPSFEAGGALNDMAKRDAGSG